MPDSRGGYYTCGIDFKMIILVSREPTTKAEAMTASSEASSSTRLTNDVGLIPKYTTRSLRLTANVELVMMKLIYDIYI